MFKAGFSSRVISPQEPVWLGGYAARNKPSCGIHDDIYTKAFYISDGETETVLVSCDIVCLMQNEVDNIRKTSLELYGIKNISVSATHTHSGPETRPKVEAGYSILAKNWIAFVEKMTIEAIGEAILSAEPMNLYSGLLPAPGVAKNRRAGETIIDDTLMVIRADDMNGQTKGLIINYPCHCTVLDANNYLISADYPGYLYKKLNEKYKNAAVMFFNGACGNINIGYSADASALGADMGDIRTFGNAEKKADILLKKIDEILLSPSLLKPRLVFRSISLEFPLKNDLPSVNELNRNISECCRKIAACKDQEEKTKLQIKKVYYDCMLDNIEGYATEGNSTISAESVLISLGDVLLITVPLELFCEIGLSIKEIFSSNWHPAILGYTNGYYGYFPTKSAHMAGGYECETSVHHADSEKYLIDVLKTAGLM